MKNYQAIVIGFGKGGKTLAGYLAAKGEKVALVEQSPKMYGGTCINVGCIPTKSLVDSAAISKAKELPTFAEKAAFYRKAVEEKARLTNMLRKKNYALLHDNPNVAIYDGAGSFVSPHEVKIVSGETETLIYGEKIFINTGSSALIPPIQGLKDCKLAYTSETLLELTKLPERLLIIGGGYIGLEFASFYRAFGAEVTVLQNGGRFIAREDESVAAAIRAEMERQGISFIFNADVQAIEQDGDIARVFYQSGGEEKQIAANAVLIATGRKPNTAALNLEAANVETTPRGGVKTDERRRSSQPHIWAMGDAVGDLQFTYVSLDDFRVVKSSLTGGAYTAANRTIPYSVFIDPPFSRVGITEKEAKEKGIEVKVAEMRAAAIPKAHVLKKPTGLLKAVVDAKTGLILGASLFCAESHEMINLIKFAMDCRIPYAAIRDHIFTHPVMSEGLNDLFALAD